MHKSTKVGKTRETTFQWLHQPVKHGLSSLLLGCRSRFSEKGLAPKTIEKLKLKLSSPGTISSNIVCGVYIMVEMIEASANVSANEDRTR